jgi:L-malate glycosyltransferase
MKKIHYHSDCPFFAGCENMLAVFFNNEELLSKFEVSFSYGKSKRYKEGLNKRVHRIGNITQFPLFLIDEYVLIGAVTQRFPKFLSTIFKIIYILFPIKYFFFFFNFIQMWFFFGRNRVDLLHINNGGYPAAMSASAATLAARLRGVRNIVYVVNNVATPYTQPIRWFDYPIDIFVKRCVSIFVTGSEFAGNALKKVLKAEKINWVKIHNGIKQRKIVESVAQVAVRLEMNPNRLHFGVVALFEERKGHIVLLKAIKHLIDRGITVPIIHLEGHGKLKQDLMLFVEKHALKKYIRFIGDEENVFDFINALDVLILPSIRDEDFPNVIIEAMSLGKPVIGTEIAGIPEQISTDTGLIISPDNIKTLANAITYLMENKQERIQFGINAKKHFNQKFEQHISVKNYMSLYKNLLEGIQ